MRGHYQGRYRDRQMVAAQAEYRVPVWWRLGVVGFAGVGQVARDVDDFHFGALHVSAGGGLRFLVSRSKRVNARGDVAWGEDDFGVYVALGEAF
jgi:outer membrane translocation and assembly module TamA